MKLQTGTRLLDRKLTRSPSRQLLNLIGDSGCKTGAMLSWTTHELDKALKVLCHGQQCLHLFSDSEAYHE